MRGHLGYRFASTKQVAEMTDAFVESIMQFGLDHKIDLVRFKKGPAQGRCHAGAAARFQKEVSRRSGLHWRHSGKGAHAPDVRKAFGNGGTIPWIDYSSANVNFYYF